MEICQKRGFAARQPTQKWKIQRKKKEVSQHYKQYQKYVVKKGTDMEFEVFTAIKI